MWEGRLFGFQEIAAAHSGGAPGTAERRQPRRAAALGGAQRRRRRESPVASQKTHFGECHVAESQKGCLLVAFFNRFKSTLREREPAYAERAVPRIGVCTCASVRTYVWGGGSALAATSDPDAACVRTTWTASLARPPAEQTCV